MDKERKSARDEREQLLTLVNGWDPAARLKAGAPRNAYHSVVDKLLALLSRNATTDEVAAFLDREIAAEFGRKPQDSQAFAKKAVAWFQMNLK